MDKLNLEKIVNFFLNKLFCCKRRLAKKAVPVSTKYSSYENKAADINDTESKEVFK
jgi:hypothetical protein